MSAMLKNVRWLYNKISNIRNEFAFEVQNFEEFSDVLGKVKIGRTYIIYCGASIASELSKGSYVYGSSGYFVKLSTSSANLTVTVGQNRIYFGRYNITSGKLSASYVITGTAV